MMGDGAVLSPDDIPAPFDMTLDVNDETLEAGLELEEVMSTGERVGHF